MPSDKTEQKADISRLEDQLNTASHHRDQLRIELLKSRNLLYVSRRRNRLHSKLLQVRNELHLAQKFIGDLATREQFLFRVLHNITPQWDGTIVPLVATISPTVLRFSYRNTASISAPNRLIDELLCPNTIFQSIYKVLISIVRLKDILFSTAATTSLTPYRICISTHPNTAGIY